MKKNQNNRRKKISKRVVKENIELGTLALPAIALLAVFTYWPMFGIVLAFKNYKATGGIFGSDWADPIFKNFEFVFKTKDAVRIARNTLRLPGHWLEHIPASGILPEPFTAIFWLPEKIMCSIRSGSQTATVIMPRDGVPAPVSVTFRSGAMR